MSLLFLVLVIIPFLSCLKRAPLKIDAIIFHFRCDSSSEALRLVHSLPFPVAVIENIPASFPSFIQLKPDAGRLASHSVPLGHSLSLIRIRSVGLVALLKMPEHFWMPIILWSWQWGFAPGHFSLGGYTAVVTRVVLLPS